MSCVCCEAACHARPKQLGVEFVVRNKGSFRPLVNLSKAALQMYRMAQLCQLCRSDPRSSVGIETACCIACNGRTDMHATPNCPVGLGKVVLPRVRATIAHRLVIKRYRASSYQAEFQACLRKFAHRYSFIRDSATQTRPDPRLQTDRAVSAVAALRVTCTLGQLRRTEMCRHVKADLGHGNQAGLVRSRAQLDVHKLFKPQAVLCLPKHRELE